MVGTRVRLLSLFAIAALTFGACSGTAGSAARTVRPAAERLGRGERRRLPRRPVPERDQGGANLQIPDVESGKFNVAMVLIGPHDDGGWSQAHYEGLQYLCQNMPDAHIAYIENVPEGADSEQVFRSLSRKGFNFIVGTSFGYMDPMDAVAKEFPDITYLHLTGYKSNGKNFGNFFGAVEDMKYMAGMLAGSRAKKDGNPEDRLHGHLPDPRRAPPRQRDHAGRQADLPRVHDGRPVHQHLARPPGRSGRRPTRCSMAVRTSSSPAPIRRPSPIPPRPRASGRSPTTTRARARTTRCLTAPYWIWGPGVRPHREAGPGQEVHRRLRVLRRRLEGDGPVRLHGGPDARRRASPTFRPPTSRRSRTRSPRRWPASGADSTSSPARSRTTPARRSSRPAAKLVQSDLDQFPPGAPGQRVQDVHVLVGRRHHRPAPQALGLLRARRPVGDSPRASSMSAHDRMTTPAACPRSRRAAS